MPTKQKLLHFDTVDGVDNYDNTFSGRQNGSGQNVTGSHSYDTRLSIATQINNVKSISLKTVEIPFLAQNIRSTNDSNYMGFYVEYNGVPPVESSITLKDKNYTSITTLLADINTAFTAKIATIPSLTGFTVEFYVNPLDTSKIIIKTNPEQTVGGLIFGDFDIYESNLSRHILGISYSSNSGNPDLFLGSGVYSYMYCTNCYNLQPDNYFNMSFTNIETAPSNASGRQTTFKIPISGSFGEVIYYSEKSGAEQKIYIDRPNTNLSYLNMVITDRWGHPVYGFGSEISFTLNIEYDEM